MLFVGMHIYIAPTKALSPVISIDERDMVIPSTLYFFLFIFIAFLAQVLSRRKKVFYSAHVAPGAPICL